MSDAEIVLRGDEETVSRLADDISGIGIREEIISEEPVDGGNA